MPLHGFRLVPVRGLLRAPGLPIAIMVLFGLSGWLAPAQAAPPAQASDPGETIFQTKCTACHTIGKGKLVGPDLKDVTTRRDPQWLKRFIADPNQMFASDPTAQQLLAENNNVKMPALGLTDAEVTALIAFLAGGAAAGGQAQAAPQTQAAPQAPAQAGDPVAGWRVFTGNASLAGGGPACIGCHSVNGLGGLGGGALGPDLTHAAQRYPGPGLAAVLGNIAFPTMIGPFANRPLTAQEQADLVAYLAAADQGNPVAPAAVAAAPGAITRDTGLVLAAGLAGAFALTLLLAVFWPRQRQSVSARLRGARKPAVD
jgi:mono/diheme cytochrome c family protein